MLNCTDYIAELERVARETADYTNEQAEELLKKLFSED